MRNWGNVFSTVPGRCFRFVTDGFGKPGQCTEPVMARGMFKDHRGVLFEVDACGIHAADLEEYVIDGVKHVRGEEQGGRYRSELTLTVDGFGCWEAAEGSGWPTELLP